MTKDTMTTVAESAGEGEDSNLITLSTGVVLKAKPVPPAVLIRTMARFTRPEIPVYLNEKLGRVVANPDHPDYQGAVEAWQMQYTEGLLNTLILYGTEIEKRPRKIPGPANDVWLDKLKATGETETEADNEFWRYLAWVQTEAAVTADDLAKIQEVVGALSGVKERDVEAAAEFPGGE